MQNRFAKAIQLRETGRAKQDQTMLEEARTLLLELLTAYPNEVEIIYQTAIVHDNLGLEREAIPFYIGALEQYAETERSHGTRVDQPAGNHL